MNEIEGTVVGYNEDGLVVDCNGIPFIMLNINIEKLNKRLIEIGKEPLKKIKVVER